MYKHIWKRFLSAILSVVMISSILCSSVSAATQSSEYLNSYRASVTPDGNGVIVVTVDVVGVGPMKKIGAKTVYIYESKDGKYFTKTGTYESKNYPIMMGSGFDYYDDAVTHQGTAGYYYYASVYVYAENDNGSDTKNYVTSIKRAT